MRLHDLGDRKEMKLERDPRFPHYKVHCNLEFMVEIDNIDDYHTERKGGCFSPTKEEIHYTFGGRVIFLPLDKMGEERRNYQVSIEHRLGTPQGNKVKSNEERGPVVHFGPEELKDYCEKYFPGLGIRGELTLATLTPLSGDFSRKDLVEMLMKGLQHSEIPYLSKAYLTFLDTFKIKEES
ncbi:MAG: hypothetical protein AABX04_07485 [Nanoarchaeota archaeon]